MKFTIKPFGVLGAVVCAVSLLFADQTPANATHATAKVPAGRGRAIKPVIHQTNLNLASRTDLMKLPGVSGELADKIIKGRPYLSKSHVLTRNVLTQVQYEMIRERIFVVTTPDMVKAAKARDAAKK